MQLAENSTSSINKICCHGTAVQSHILMQFLGLGNMGKYSVLRLCIAPPCGRANTELNISPYVTL